MPGAKISSMNWLDVCIGGWLLVGAFKGFRTGLFRSGARLAGAILSIYLAVRNAPALGTYLSERTPVGDAVRAMVEKAGVVSPEAAQLPAEQAADAFSGTLAELPIPSSWVVPVNATGLTLGEYITRLISTLVLESLAFLLIMIVVFLALDMIGRVVQGLVGRLPLGWIVNNGGGLAFGLMVSSIQAAFLVGIIAITDKLIPLPGVDPLAGSLAAPTFLDLYRRLVSLIGF